MVGLTTVRGHMSLRKELVVFSVLVSGLFSCMGLLALLVALGERDDKVMAALAAVFGALCLIVAAMAAF